MLTFILKHLLWLKMVPILSLLVVKEDSALHQVSLYNVYTLYVGLQTFLGRCFLTAP